MTTTPKTLPALLAASLLALPACGESDVDPTSTPQTESATPDTPTPTATVELERIDAWYASQALSLADENTGLDIDGDSTKDNNLVLVANDIIDEVEAVLFDMVDQQTDVPGQIDPCESTEVGCTLSPVQAESIKIGISLQLPSVPAEPLCGSIGCMDPGSHIPLGLNISGNERDGTLALWDGNSTPDQYTPETEIGRLNGTVFVNGYVSRFGPGETTLPLSMLVAREGLEGSIALQDSVAEVVLTPPEIHNGLIAGGISTGQLLNAMELLIEEIAGTLGLDPGVIPNPDMAELEAVIEASSDITCTSGDACISATLEFSAATTTVN